MKQQLWKDIWKSIRKSKGRFFSIAGLMMLGSFALVGLIVTGPDMRAAGRNYFDKLNVADIIVIGDLGLDAHDREVMNGIKGATGIEFGYLKDVVAKGTEISFRIFSKPDKISDYQIVKGRLPNTDDEIAIGNKYADDYKIGDTISFTEQADAYGNKTLKKHKFKIVGYIYSGEIISNINMGATTAGTGELKGYAVVSKDVFESDVYMIARMAFEDTKKLNPYSDEYTYKIQKHKETLKKMMKDQPQIRLASVKTEYQDKIDEGQSKIDDAKQKLGNTQNQLDDAKIQLSQGQEEISENEGKLDTQVSEAERRIEDGETRISDAKAALNQANSQLREAPAAISQGKQQIQAGYQQVTANQQKMDAAEQQIAAGEQELAKNQAAYDEKNQIYQDAVQELNKKKEEYQGGKAQIEAKQAELDAAQNQLNTAKSGYEQKIAVLEDKIKNTNDPDEEASLETILNSLKQEYDVFLMHTYMHGMAQMEAGRQELDGKKQELEKAKQAIAGADVKLNESGEALGQAAKQIDAAKAKLESGKQEAAVGKEQIAAAKQMLTEKEQLLQQKEAEYQKNLSEIQQAETGLADKEAELAEAKEQLEEQRAKGEQKLAEARQELADRQKEYEEKNQVFLEKKTDVDREISENEAELKDAQETLDSLEPPVYAINSRRETPGSEGYKIYTSVSRIIDALAKVFPIFLYFVAALVTFTTMTRFVDEERINSGTLKALGYSNADVMKKFIFYGLISGTLGSIAGIILGHTLFPMIVNNAYNSGFTLPAIQLDFHPGITIVALFLALLSAVLPAWIVASRELQERPAQLLLPKPPTAGSKILVERISYVWDHLNFTHKVTARNLFRYKKRMFMTIFGVAGSVSLLFAGFSVQHSIAEINDRQFGEIIRYDIIVAENPHVTGSQQKEIDNLIKSDAVKTSASVHYEELEKVAGKNQDTQEIKLIVPDTTENFDDYIHLYNRKSGKQLSLPDDGVIISERLARLLDAAEGDTITMQDQNNTNIQMKVEGITEMYMGHFIFTSRQGYEKIFDGDFTNNAYLVNLKDSSIENTEKQSAAFIKADGVKGVVQNTTLMNQIDAIVHALDKIMKVLIVVAALLGIVILYNLTNINVSERIRELSTIKVLGFFDKEVTLYIYRETILLTLLGILAGFAIGEALHQYIIKVVPPDDVMFNPALWGSSFLIPTIIISLVTLILGFEVNRRLKRVNMLEALKSVD